MTNCQNCGAPVDPTADRCAYCGTPYPWAVKTAYEAAPVQIIMDPREIARVSRALDLGLITRNEARRRLGLREV